MIPNNKLLLTSLINIHKKVTISRHITIIGQGTGIAPPGGVYPTVVPCTYTAQEEVTPIVSCPQVKTCRPYGSTIR